MNSVKSKEQQSLGELKEVLGRKESLVDRFQTCKNKAFEMLRKYSKDIDDDLDRVKKELRHDEKRDVIYLMSYKLDWWNLDASVAKCE